jgi:hypothetical protein
MKPVVTQIRNTQYFVTPKYGPLYSVDFVVEIYDAERLPFVPLAAMECSEVISSSERSHTAFCRSQRLFSPEVLPSFNIVELETPR